MEWSDSTLRITCDIYCALNASVKHAYKKLAS